MHILSKSTKIKAMTFSILAVILLFFLYFHLVRTNSNRSDTENLKSASLGLGNTANSKQHREVSKTQLGDISSPSDDDQKNTAKAGNSLDGIPRLSFENTLISGNSLNAKSIYSTIESDKKFSDAMSKLRDEALQDPDTLELTRRYNQAIDSLGLVNKNIRLNDFVCGSTICMGSLRETALTSGWEDWLTNFENNKNTPHYAIIDTTIDLGNGQYEHRIVTSINKNVPGIMSK